MDILLVFGSFGLIIILHVCAGALYILHSSGIRPYPFHMSAFASRQPIIP